MKLHFNMLFTITIYKNFSDIKENFSSKKHSLRRSHLCYCNQELLFYFQLEEQKQLDLFLRFVWKTVRRKYSTFQRYCIFETLSAPIPDEEKKST